MTLQTQNINGQLCVTDTLNPGVPYTGLAQLGGVVVASAAKTLSDRHLGSGYLKLINSGIIKDNSNGSIIVSNSLGDIISFNTTGSISQYPLTINNIVLSGNRVQSNIDLYIGITGSHYLSMAGGIVSLYKDLLPINPSVYSLGSDTYPFKSATLSSGITIGNMVISTGLVSLPSITSTGNFSASNISTTGNISGNTISGDLTSRKIYLQSLKDNGISASGNIFVDTDTVNTGVSALYILPYATNNRLFLGRPNKAFYSVNFSNVSNIESMPATDIGTTYGPISVGGINSSALARYNNGFAIISNLSNGDGVQFYASTGFGNAALSQHIFKIHPNRYTDLYNAYTSNSQYESLRTLWTGNEVIISPYAVGTGVLRNFYLGYRGFKIAQITSSGITMASGNLYGNFVSSTGSVSGLTATGITTKSISFVGTGTNALLTTNTFGDMFSLDKGLIASSLQLNSTQGAMCRNNGYYYLGVNGVIAWASTSDGNGTKDLSIYREYAGTSSQYDGNNPQRSLLYNTRTSASIFERLNFGWYNNTGCVKTESSGDGSPRSLLLDSNLDLYLNSSGSTYIQSTGLILTNLPTSNPGIPGSVWNDSGTLKIS